MKAGRAIFIFSSEMVLICLLWGCLMSSFAWADSSNWKVQRRGRSQELIKQLRARLLKAPFSSYIFRRLLKFYRSRSSQRHFLRSYQKNNGPKRSFSHQVILARLLLRFGKYDSACRLFNKLRRLRLQKKIHFSLLQMSWNCQVKRGRLQRAWLLYLKLSTHHLRNKYQNQMLFTMLRLSLVGSRPGPLFELLRECGRRSLSSSMMMKLARLFIARGRIGVGLKFYKRGMKRASRSRRVKMSSAMIRLCLQKERFRAGLRILVLARRLRGVPSWVKREWFGFEIALFRGQKRLPFLISQLEHRWARTKKFKQMMILARLHQEINSSGRWKWYKRAILSKPRARAPRLALISYFFRRGWRKKGFDQIKLLIRYNRAFPRHYLRLSKYLLIARAEHPPQRPWQRNWKTKWKKGCRVAWPKRLRARFCMHRPSCRALVKCSKKRWKRYRAIIWKNWKSDALPRERHDFQKAQRILHLCLQRFPRDWGALFAIESLLTWHGLFRDANVAFRMLVRATRIKPVQLRALAVRMKRRGREHLLLPLLRRAMYAAKLSLVHVLRLASFAKRPLWNKESLVPVSQKKHWKQLICPSVRRMLHRKLKMHNQKGALLYNSRLKLAGLLWSCGDRSRVLRRWMHSVKLLARGHLKRLYPLLHYLIQMRDKKGLFRVLNDASSSAFRKNLLQEIRRLIQNQVTSRSLFFLRRISREILHSHPGIFAFVLEKLCQKKRSCLLYRSDFRLLLSRKSVPVPVLMLVLSSVSRHGIFLPERLRFLPLLANRIPPHSKDLIDLLSVDSAFSDHRRLRTLHLGLLLSFSSARLGILDNRALRALGVSLEKHQHLIAWERQNRLVHVSICRVARHLLSQMLLRWPTRWSQPMINASKAFGRTIKTCVTRKILNKKHFRQILLAISKQKEAGRRKVLFFRFVLRHQILAALQMMLLSPTKGAKKQSFSSVLGTLSVEEKDAFVGVFQRHCFKHMDRVSPMVHKIIFQLCSGRTSLCRQIFRCFIPVMHSRNTAPKKLIFLLRTTLKSRLQNSPVYVAFVRRLIEYWKETFLTEGWLQERNFEALHMLVEAEDLFRSAIPTLRKQLAETHLKLIVYLLKRRMTFPSHAAKWKRMMAHYLQYGEYYFMPSFQVRLKAWLKRESTSSRVLFWMCVWLTKSGQHFYAKIQKMRGLFLGARVHHLRWLMMIEPIFQMFPSSSIEHQWRVFFKQKPKEIALSSIRNWTKRCCFDAPSKRMATRLLLVGLTLHGEKNLMFDIRRIAPKLEDFQRRLVLMKLSQQMRNQLGFSLPSKSETARQPIK